MPIEFLCTACPKKLRVPDNSAGKQVKCPSCGQLQVIPAATASSQAPPSDDIVSSMRSDGPNPFADDLDNPFQSPGPDASAPSPYAAKPRGSSGMTQETAKVLLTIPAAILLVIQAINFCFSALMICGMLYIMLNPPQGAKDDQQMLFLGMAVGGGVATIMSIGAIVGLGNAIFRKSYAFSWVGMILGMMPCTLMFSCLTMLVALIAFPVGIWGIVMLCLPEGKAQFR
ncbi:hypothetical protein [Blastopirellula marina]|uniref:Zinc finger/thioredoxin putative domain-containing protein n=1 Tax=Blastopirellula marina DSM 3645 TaxID=314230 RepID=A3ZRS2_9BACT|nr:hypothetical protein [Blastopirellula marina]EAQ80841.1 hypothetical protein DSM3645_12511 [Blastopirellula marina DSM 3645]